MYQLLRGRSPKDIFVDALPPLVIAFVIAELFFKWKSFTLECVGFLVTWFVLDWVWSKVMAWRAASAAGPTG
jgi:hypothetical protein